MNDILPYEQEPSPTIIVNKNLVKNFVDTVSKDQATHGNRENKAGLFLESFKILLEAHGLVPSNEARFASFWQKVTELAESYHKSYKDSFASLPQMEANTQLDKTISKLVKEYYSLFCSNEVAPIDSGKKIKQLQAKYQTQEMHGL